MKSIASDLFDEIPRETVSDLVSMYMLTKELCLSVRSERDDECTELFCKLIPPYLSCTCAMLPERQQMDILHCIAYEMAFPSGDALYERCVKFYEIVCLNWLAHLGSDCSWTGMDVTLAMERLQLLKDGMEIFELISLKDKTARAYGHYHNLNI